MSAAETRRGDLVSGEGEGPGAPHMLEQGQHNVLLPQTGWLCGAGVCSVWEGDLSRGVLWGVSSRAGPPGLCVRSGQSRGSALSSGEGIVETVGKEPGAQRVRCRGKRTWGGPQLEGPERVEPLRQPGKVVRKPCGPELGKPPSAVGESPINMGRLTPENEPRPEFLRRLFGIRPHEKSRKCLHFKLLNFELSVFTLRC